MEGSSGLQSSSSIRHIVAVPHAARSHLNAMINLCNILASQEPGDNFVITVVVTQDRLPSIASEYGHNSNNLRFETIPDVIPSESVRATNFRLFIDSVFTKMEAPFQQLLDWIQPPATVIMADFVLRWIYDVGRRRNIPVASFFPMSAMFFSIFHHFDLLLQNGHYPVDISENGDEFVDYFPGVSPLRLRSLPTFILAGCDTFHEMMDIISLVNHKAQYLLLATIYEFDPRVVDILRTKLPFPIYTVGPAIPYFKLVKSSSSIVTTTSTLYNETNYLTWLDCQPVNSVLYISFGSFLTVSSSQKDEFAAGLRQSGVRFLWTACQEPQRLKDKCGDMGLVLPWCDQLKVLCHPSVGGFWSHCGWNSVQEGVFAGVPFLTFPITYDQNPNDKLIVGDWKIGFEMKKSVQDFVGKDEVAVVVRKFMDLEGDEGKQIRKKAKELQAVCHNAIAKGGSSESNIKNFFQDISSHTL